MTSRAETRSIPGGVIGVVAASGARCSPTYLRGPLALADADGHGLAVRRVLRPQGPEYGTSIAWGFA
jgi:hypothetical protein